MPERRRLPPELAAEPLSGASSDSEPAELAPSPRSSSALRNGRRQLEIGLVLATCAAALLGAWTVVDLVREPPGADVAPERLVVVAASATSAPPPTGGTAPPARDASVAIGGLRYLTIDPYNGRTGNQFMQLEWAFRVARAFNRTVVLPAPKWPHNVGLPPTRAGESRFWDMAHMRASVEFAGHEDALLHGVHWERHDDVPPECVWDSGKVANVVSWTRAADRLPACARRLHYFAKSGMVSGHRVDTRRLGVDPLLLFRSMRFSEAWLSAARAYVAPPERWERWRAPDRSSPLLGIHVRTWRGDADGLSRAPSLQEAIDDVCMPGTRGILARAVETAQARARCGLRALAGGAWTPDAVLATWEARNMSAACLPWSEEVMLTLLGRPDRDRLREVGFIAASDHAVPDTDGVIRGMGGSVAREHEDRLFGLFADLAVLVHDADVFVGSPASTLTQSVCLWRRALREDYDPAARDVCNVVWLATYSRDCKELVEE